MAATLGVNTTLLRNLKPFCMFGNPRFKGNRAENANTFSGLRFENIGDQMEGMTLIHGVTLAYGLQLITSKVHWYNGAPGAVVYVKPDVSRIKGLNHRIWEIENPDAMPDLPYLKPRGTAAVVREEEDLGLVFPATWEYGFNYGPLFPDFREVLGLPCSNASDMQIHPATLGLASSPLVAEGLSPNDNVSVYFRYTHSAENNVRGFIISRSGYFMLTYPINQRDTRFIPAFFSETGDTQDVDEYITN